MRFVTMRSRLLTSLMAAAGLPGGSVHASVTRNGCVCPLVETVTINVWLSPVASALVGFWS